MAMVKQAWRALGMVALVAAGASACACEKGANAPAQAGQQGSEGHKGAPAQQAAPEQKQEAAGQQGSVGQQGSAGQKDNDETDLHERMHEQDPELREPMRDEVNDPQKRERMTDPELRERPATMPPEIMPK
jgi:hypothetical protein